MKSTRVIRIIVCVCRALQLPIALIALGLTASLIPTFDALNDNCPPDTLEFHGIPCRRLHETQGGLHFGLATTLLALVDFGVGAVDLWKPDLPFLPHWLILTCDSVTAGFYLGSGSTIAARLNGEFCDSGPRDPHFACGRLFADMGFMFVGAVLSYVLVACFWVVRARRAHGCSAEVEGQGQGQDRGRESESHTMENPFRDPSAGAGPEADARGEIVSNKRRSWSQLS